MISAYGETSICAQFWLSHPRKINSNRNMSWQGLARIRRRMENQNTKELVSHSLANENRERDNYTV